jgi:hypothetical protein
MPAVAPKRPPGQGAQEAALTCRVKLLKVPALQFVQAVMTPPTENVPSGHAARPPLTGGQ